MPSGSPVSLKPEVKICTLRLPEAMQSRKASGTCGAGSERTTRSTGSGNAVRAGIGLEAVDLVGLGVDGIEPAGKAEVADAAEDAGKGADPGAGHAHDGDGSGVAHDFQGRIDLFAALTLRGLTRQAEPLA